MRANKVLNVIAIVVTAVVVVWACLSWREVTNNNMTPGYVYSNLNLFKLLFW